MTFSNELSSLASKEMKLIQNQIQERLDKIEDIRRVTQEKIAQLSEEIDGLESQYARLEFVVTGKMPKSGAAPERVKLVSTRKRASSLVEYTGKWKAESVDGKPSILFETVGGGWVSKAGKRSKEMVDALSQL